MKYRKPICDCGCELKISNVITCKRTINDDGYVSDMSCLDAIHSITGTLTCPKCGNTYDIYADEKDRILKGEILSK